MTSYTGCVIDIKTRKVIDIYTVDARDGEEAYDIIHKELIQDDPRWELSIEPNINEDGGEDR